MDKKEAIDNQTVLKYMERIIGLAVAIILGFIAYQSTTWTKNIESLTTSVSELNIQMRGLLTEVSYTKENLQNKTIKDDIQDSQIRDLDRRMIKQENLQ